MSPTAPPPDENDESDGTIPATQLLAELHSLPEESAQRKALRDRLVEAHMPLVIYLARRFSGRNEPMNDLVQVGAIGLIKAIDRFDPSRGLEFSTYATPTILGEIKRHFRDKGWAIRVPRRLQELRMSIASVTSELAQTLGRSPTPREVAVHLGVTIEDVLEGLESANAYATLSLDAGDGSEDGLGSILETMGALDEALDHVELRESVRPLIEQLPAREKQILMLRFFRQMTQSQIAEEVGISQMHVSRLLNRTLAELRESIR